MKIKTQAPLGQWLLENRLISLQQLECALVQQAQKNKPLGEVLLELDFIQDPKIILEGLSQQLGLEVVNLKNVTIQPQALECIPAPMAIFYQCLPLFFRDQKLFLATADPLNSPMLDELNLLVKHPIQMVLAEKKLIMEAIREKYGLGADTLDRISHEGSQNLPESLVHDLEDLGSEASVANLINQILLEGYHRRATDVHFEPFEKDLRIRYRIDGVLENVRLPQNVWQFRDMMISRIKVMAQLDIAEKRLPQDGRCKVKAGEIELDLRISCLPSSYGESLVIRILNSRRLLDVPELGFSAQQLEQFHRLLQQPHGIIFVTGPTGSGKTTTLYAGLNFLTKSSRKIITIEDPIEYQISGIIQIPVNPAIGLTFARGLRSMLRHDPDVMMVGEVRDAETAQIAIQSALTGHLVLSTLHTNDAASAVARLMDMGIEPYLITSSVQCFMAQRLVKTICRHCKEEEKAVVQQEEIFSLFGERVAGGVFFRGKGCEACRFTGYQGREAIYEFLVLEEGVRELILKKASSTEIKRKAMERGMKTLLDHGWQKVAQGVTTLSEVIRVTKES